MTSGNVERAYESLDQLWARGQEFLGCRSAILGGAMSWISERSLVSAISNAGGFGVLACGSMSPAQLEEEIGATADLTALPFGVNLITMHPQIDDLIDVCLASSRVRHIVLAGGLPSASSIRRVKDGGAKVICFSPALVLAKRLIRSGVDALVIEGTEAGGHIGPVATNVLAQEILPHIKDVPVFVAGGIGRGESLVSYLQMGASGVQMGTRFVCARECVAHPAFKEAFLKAGARDAVPTVQIDPQFPVIPVRALVNRGTERFMAVQREVISRFHAGEIDQKSAQLEIEHFWAGALRRAVIEGDVESGSLMAGQSVGFVTREQTVSDIFAELIQQAVDFLGTSEDRLVLSD